MSNKNNNNIDSQVDSSEPITASHPNCVNCCSNTINLVQPQQLDGGVSGNSSCHLHMIQEEQNEMSILSSESSSPLSSVSTTPRMCRSSLSINPKESSCIINGSILSNENQSVRRSSLTDHYNSNLNSSKNILLNNSNNLMMLNNCNTNTTEPYSFLSNLPSLNQLNPNLFASLSNQGSNLSFLNHQNNGKNNKSDSKDSN